MNKVIEQALEQELQPIDLAILPEVGLTLRTGWQRQGTGAALTGEVREALPYTVTGPPEVTSFLELEGGAPIAVSGVGYMSPPHRITIQGERARLAGIPKNAMSYAFCYPMDTLASQYERLICEEERADPWLFFLLLGGYAYFDVNRVLICTNAFVLTPTETMLTLAGPFQPSDDAVRALRDAARLRTITLTPLLEQGFERFAWINPGEKPGGAALLADGSPLSNNGCFLYELAGGALVLYSLVNKALFDLTEDSARCLLAPADPAHSPLPLSLPWRPLCHSPRHSPSPQPFATGRCHRPRHSPLPPPSPQPSATALCRSPVPQPFPIALTIALRPHVVFERAQRPHEHPPPRLDG